MLVLKKLFFAPFFLIALVVLIYQLNTLFTSYDFIFSLSLNTLLQLVILGSAIGVTSLLFVLFVTIAQDWKIVLPVGILALILPLIFLNLTLGIVFVVGVLISLLLTFLNLENTLKTYLTFTPVTLLGPSIRHLCSLLILTISITYFLAINKIVVEQGFEIPDALIDSALEITNPVGRLTENTEIPELNLASDQIALLKQNPDLLKQSGIDPKILDTIGNSDALKAPKELANEVIKQTVKDQLQNIIKPYLNFIPAALALILFFTLSSITSLLNLLIYPLIWIIFYILEKSGFAKFTEEMRPVRKMVI